MGSSTRTISTGSVVSIKQADLLCQMARKGRAVLRWSSATPVARRAVERRESSAHG